MQIGGRMSDRIQESTDQALEEARIPNYLWLVVGIPWFVVVLGHLGNFAIGTMLPSIAEGLEFGPRLAGYLSGVGWFTTALVTIPVTYIVTLVGPKKVLLVVFAFLAVALFLQAVAFNFTMLLIGRALAVGFIAALRPSLVVLKQQWCPARHLSMVNGIEAFTTPAGQMLGTAIVPFLMAVLGGWRPVFSILAVAVGIVAYLWLIFGKERQSKAFEEAWTDESVCLIGDTLKLKDVWLLAIGWPGTSFVWIAVMTFWPTYAVENLGLEMTQAGPILSTMSVGSMVASLMAPSMAKALGRDRPMIWGWGFVLPFAYYGLLATSNPVLLTISAFVAGFGAFAFVPIAFTHLYKIPSIHPRVVSIATSVVTTAVMLGATGGGVVAGVLFEQFGGLYEALAVTCVSPLTLGICGLFLGEYGRKYQEEMAAEDISDNASRTMEAGLGAE